MIAAPAGLHSARAQTGTVPEPASFGDLAARLLPWIPDVQLTNVLILSKGLTGATASFSYMFAPWADHLGGT